MSLGESMVFAGGEDPSNEWLLNGTQLSNSALPTQSMVDDANEWLLNGTHMPQTSCATSYPVVTPTSSSLSVPANTGRHIQKVVQPHLFFIQSYSSFDISGLFFQKKIKCELFLYFALFIILTMYIMLTAIGGNV